jgi:hypothetical protein
VLSPQGDHGARTVTPARAGRQQPEMAARRRRRPGGRGPVCAVVPGQVRVVRRPSLAIGAMTHGRPRQSDPRRSGTCAEVGEGLDVFGKCGGAGLGQATLTGTFTLIPPTVDITAEISASMRRFQRTASVITSGWKEPSEPERGVVMVGAARRRCTSPA